MEVNKMPNRDGKGSREDSYRRQVEGKQEGRRIEAREDCPEAEKEEE